MKPGGCLSLPAASRVYGKELRNRYLVVGKGQHRDGPCTAGEFDDIDAIPDVSLRYEHPASTAIVPPADEFPIEETMEPLSTLFEKRRRNVA